MKASFRTHKSLLERPSMVGLSFLWRRQRWLWGLAIASLLLWSGSVLGTPPNSNEGIYPTTPLPSIENDPFEDVVDLLRRKDRAQHCDGPEGHALMTKISKLETLNQVAYDASRDTLLHMAVKMNCPTLTHWLLEQGIDWKIRNRERMNAFDVAVRMGNQQVLKVFLEKLSGGPISFAASKTKIGIKPIEALKKSEIEVKVGFSLANISGEQIISLNAALKGLYRYDSRTVMKGRAEVFFTKVEQDITTFRYLVEGRVLRENLFEKEWNGAINVKAEGYPEINTLDIAAVVDRTWQLFGKTLSVNAAIGPGVRYVHRSGSNQGTDVEPIMQALQGLEWKPKSDFAFLKGGQYTLSENWTYTEGRSGFSSVLEVSAKHNINDSFAAGITYKYWKNNLLDKDVDDNQILFELSYQNNKKN